MDPTAPGSQDPQNTNPTNPIRPGQFIVAGEDASQNQPSINQFPPAPSTPTPAFQSPPQTLAAMPPSPPLAPAPSGNPEELLASLAKQTEGAVLPHQNPQDTQQAAPFQSSPINEFQPPPAAPPPAEPVLNLASEIPPIQNEPLQPAGQDLAPQSENTPPDPTPYAPPSAGPPPSQEGSKMDKIKIVLMGAGVLVLVGLLASLAWFFVFNKPNGAAKTEITQEDLIEDLPQIPKRTQGGFGDLPSSTSSGSTPASPSPSPEDQNSDITIPDLTGF